MNVKPSYLKLLNRISSGEKQAQLQFAAWEAVASDADLRRLLALVAAREGEHAYAFEKRVIELGFSVQPRPLPDFEAKLTLLANPAVSDLAKLEAMGYDSTTAVPDAFGFNHYFDDETIDIDTGTLLGRYIAEERDTSRRLIAFQSRLKNQVTAAI